MSLQVSTETQPESNDISRRDFLIGLASGASVMALSACAVPPAPIAAPTNAGNTETEPTATPTTRIPEVENQETEALVQATRIMSEVYRTGTYSKHLRNLIFLDSTIAGIAGFMDVAMETPPEVERKASDLITYSNHLMALAATLDAATLTLFETTGDISFDPSNSGHKKLFDQLLEQRPMRAVLLAMQYAGRTDDTDIEKLGITRGEGSLLKAYIDNAYIFGGIAIAEGIVKGIGGYIESSQTSTNLQPTDYCRIAGDGSFIDGAGIISYAHKQSGHTQPTDGIHNALSDEETIDVCRSLIPHWNTTQDFFDQID